MALAAIYIRVSTDEQAKSGFSLADQLAVCRRRLVKMGLEAGQTYIDDGYSGEFLERPALDRLRNDLRQGLINNIIIYDPDRLSRNLTNQLILADEFEKAGAGLMFITGDYDCSPEGRLFFAIRGAIAAFEKAKIRERTIRGKRAKATQGKIIQNAKPLGFDWDPENCRYIINEAEAKIIRLIYSLCIDHHLGTYNITRELKNLQIVGKSGRPLAVSTVNKILTKEMYCGRYYQFREVTKMTGQKTRQIRKNAPEQQVLIDIPAIISRETWQAAQEQLQKNRSLALRNAKHDYLLRGILYCPLCRRKITARRQIQRRQKTAAKIYYYYSCIAHHSAAYATGSQHCENKYLPAAKLETAVWQALVNITTGWKISRQPDPDAGRAALTQKKAAINQKKATIAQWYREGLLNGEDAEKQLASLGRELTAITDLLIALNRPPAAEPASGRPAADILNAATFAQKRAILLSLPYKIYAVKRAPRPVFWFES